MSDIDPTEINAPVVGARKRTDDANRLAAEIASVAEMTYSNLRLAWRRHYRSHPPNKLSRDLLELGVAWKIQENALGGLSAAVSRQIAGLAKTMEAKSDLVKARSVSLKPGARLLRSWGARPTRSWSSRTASFGLARRGGRYPRSPVR
jgi:hypothetical protein